MSTYKWLGPKLGTRFAICAGILALSNSLWANDPQHILDGRQLVNEIQAAQDDGFLEDDNNVELNRYGGSWPAPFVRFSDPQNDVMPGAYARCGSFVTRLLEHSYGWSWSDYEFFDPILLIDKTSASPSSYRYEAMIKQGVGFTAEYDAIDEVLPGDVVTFVDVGTDDGHTALVNKIDLDSALAYPENLDASNPELFGTWYVEMDVLDSSSGNHSNDTRVFEHEGQEIDTDGVGIGTMGLLVDDQMNVVGHTWSLPNSDYLDSPNGWLSGLHSRLHLQSDRAVTFGRLEVAPAPEPPQDDAPPAEPQFAITHEVLPPAAFGPAHLNLGLQLVNQIVEQQSNGILNDVSDVAYNRYGGSWSSDSDQVYIDWATENNAAASYSKCSSFVSLLLQEAYGWNWYDYQFYDPVQDKLHNTTSPASYRYVALIKQLIGFDQHVQRLDQAAAGDVVAYHEVGTTSGHTMLLVDVDWNSAKPYPEQELDSDPNLFGTTYYEVRVLDVNRSAHSDDTRRITIDGEEDKTGGAGVGVIGILVDNDFNVVAHSWSVPGWNYDTRKDKWVTSLNGRLKMQEDHELVIGRLAAPE